MDKSEFRDDFIRPCGAAIFTPAGLGTVSFRTQALTGP